MQSNPANSSTLNQLRNNVDRQRLSTLFQRWYLVENESWADVHLSTLFQRWQNNVEATSIELRWFNVYEPMLSQRWNLVEIESWANVCLSTLFQRWWNNVETTLKELLQFNVDDPMLFQRWYFGWKWKLNQRMFIGFASTLRKQHWNNFVNCCTDLYWCSLESGSKRKQN